MDALGSAPDICTWWGQWVPLTIHVSIYNFLREPWQPWRIRKLSYGPKHHSWCELWSGPKVWWRAIYGLVHALRIFQRLWSPNHPLLGLSHCKGNIQLGLSQCMGGTGSRSGFVDTNLVDHLVLRSTMDRAEPNLISRLMLHSWSNIYRGSHYNKSLGYWCMGPIFLERSHAKSNYIYQ